MSSPSKASRARSEAEERAESSSMRTARSAPIRSGPIEQRSVGRTEHPSKQEPVEKPAAIESSESEAAQTAEQLERAAREGDVRWRQLLAGGTPREVLCRIVQGDPLGMRERVAWRLHAEAYLLDADRVQLRALARCARFANRYQGRPDLARWLEEIVDEAIADLVRADLELDLERGKPASTAGSAFSALAPPLGLEPDGMRRACAAFNQLPPPDRRAFFELVIHGRTLDELARSSGENASDIARRARRALDLLLQVHAVEPSVPARKSAPREAQELRSPAVGMAGTESTGRSWFRSSSSAAESTEGASAESHVLPTDSAEPNSRESDSSEMDSSELRPSEPGSPEFDAAELESEEQA